MIYNHQQKAIDYIVNKFKNQPNIEALLISGSIAHGFNDEYSDVDINIVVSNDVYEEKFNKNELTYFEKADQFYEDGYFDGKFITIDYLELVLKQGNEPTKFALHDAQIAFDKTGEVSKLLEQIGVYKTDCIDENTISFLAQIDAWKWYCEEALRKKNEYLLETSVSKFILFSGRLILLENKMFFPYHKWFMKALENAPKKPSEFIEAIENLLKYKTLDNIEFLYNLVKNYKDWTNGVEYSWTSRFVYDTETVWMREHDFIENL